MARRKKNRSTQRRALECTCDLRHDVNPPKYADHEGSCELWALEDFMNGLLDWDPIAQRTVHVFDSALDDDDWGYGFAEPDLQRIVDATISGGMSAGLAGRGKGSGYVSCRHNLTEVRLPDEAGTTVYCSGSMDAKSPGRWMRPDWAVYLCGSWHARGMALFVPWQDYGTPTVPWHEVRWAAEDVYKRALAGQRVEIGCMGGHGRTGTLLSCLVMLADPNMTAKGAVEWVRKNYCFKAVEDESQRYFLEWFADPTLAPVYVRPEPPKRDVTVIGPKDGTACNWSKNGVPCAYELGHKGGHMYPKSSGKLPVHVYASVETDGSIATVEVCK